jgi:WD40 repeat protein
LPALGIELSPRTPTTSGEISVGSCVQPDLEQAGAKQSGIGGPFPTAEPLQAHFTYRIIGFNLKPGATPGPVIATAGNPESTARLWDAASGRALATLEGHTGPLRSATFSPDGSRVATTSYDETARVWDAATGHLLAVLKGHTGLVSPAAFSPDGTRVATGSSDDTARVWDATSGRSLAILAGHRDWVISAAFSPEGDRVITGSLDGTARIWSASSGRLLATLSGHTHGVPVVSFSPDGTRVVTGYYGGKMRVWNSTGDLPLAEFRGRDHIAAASFSPDGKRVVAAEGDHTVTVWDVASAHPVAVLRGHAFAVTAVSFSPDGARVITGSPDETVRIWDAATGDALAVLDGPRHWIRAIALTPDGARMVTESEGKSRWPWDSETVLWDVASGQARVTVEGRRGGPDPSGGPSLAFSPDSSRVFSIDGDVAHVRDATTGQIVATLEGDMGSAGAVSFDSTGGRLAIAGDRMVGIWGAPGYSVLSIVTDGPLKRFLPWARGLISRPTAWAAGFSPDGTRVVTGTSFHDALVWDLATGRVVTVLDGHGNGVIAAAFSPDGTRIVTEFGDGTARIWDAVSGRTQATLGGGWFGSIFGSIGSPLFLQPSPVRAASFNPDGTRVITLSRDSPVQIRNEMDGWRLAAPPPIRPGTMVGGAGWSKDGAPLVVTCETRWPLPSNAPPRR